MERTIFPGTRTSTSLNTVGHAGLKEVPLLLQIVSTSTITMKTGPLSVSMPNKLLTPKPVDLVTEETQLRFTSMLMTSDSSTAHANNTSLTTCRLRTQQLTNAEIAQAPLLQQGMTV